MPGCYALIVAAGSGRRLGGEKPKQYMDLGGTSVLAAAAGAFVRHPGIDGVRCVIARNDEDLYRQAINGLEMMQPVFGGDTRQHSVLLGLESLSENSPDKVLIHDGARPFVNAETISTVIAKLDSHPGAVPVVPVVDTIKKIPGDFIDETVPREKMFRAQTPQGFLFGEILAAHRNVDDGVTDDSSLLEMSGLKVAAVAGSENNFKITTVDDLERARNHVAGLAGGAETRTGLGFDVHRLGGEGPVRLCGVDIDYHMGMVGHSDGDVALHALSDALYGTIGAGDIGQHFPPSDERWKGADSSIFLRHALDMVKSRGGRVVNIDITIICEAPKISPHRERMVGRISEISAIEPMRVSIKATTTEGLGTTGRGEGIAVQAVVSVAFPAK